ncbi:MAG: D-alanine--D-alanine ligase [Gammaproteobacteria bacterium]|nr:D-alanine--D-alanine ligase [Gammaproteobacteria bacterium]
MRPQDPKVSTAKPARSSISLQKATFGRTAHYPQRSLHHPIQTTVLLGDPRLNDPIKKEGKFNTEDFETVTKLKKALKGIDNYQFQYIDNHKTLLQQLMLSCPEFVFNLCDEGFNNQAQLELHIPALLELLNIPYTGSGPACLAQCYNKSLVNAMAKNLDIAVPEEIYKEAETQKTIFPTLFPVLVKPNLGDGSLGITQQAVIQNSIELNHYLSHLPPVLAKTDLLIQEYLAGAEYSVGIIGNKGSLEILPILKVNYSHLPEGLPHILCYESKWLPDSPYWDKISYEEAALSDKMARKLIEASIKLFEFLDCRDYARFDFRADVHGTIKLLEVNPNPGWCWDGKFNLMAKWADLNYKNLLEKILDTAQKRYQLR